MNISIQTLLSEAGALSAERLPASERCLLVEGYTRLYHRVSDPAATAPAGDCAAAVYSRLQQAGDELSRCMKQSDLSVSDRARCAARLMESYRTPSDFVRLDDALAVAYDLLDPLDTGRISAPSATPEIVELLSSLDYFVPAENAGRTAVEIIGRWSAPTFSGRVSLPACLDRICAVSWCGNRVPGFESRTCLEGDMMRIFPLLGDEADHCLLHARFVSVAMESGAAGRYGSYNARFLDNLLRCAVPVSPALRFNLLTKFI